MKKLPALFLLLLAISCHEVLPGNSTDNGGGGGSSASFDIKILPSASVEIEAGKSAEVSYVITPEVAVSSVTVAAPDKVQAVVTPADGTKLSGTIKLTLAADVTESSLQAVVLALSGKETATKTIDITVRGGGEPVTPPTPGEFIDRRQVRTIKMVEDGTKTSYAWFEYNTQKRVTKATIQDNKDNRATFNYSYPTASSIIATCQEYEMSASFFISEGRLVSVTESSGDRMSFTYDSNGHLTSYNGKTCVWTGEDMTSIQDNNYTLNIRPSARQDNNGVSFLIATSDGDIEDLYTYPVLAPLPGINSAHLPGSLTYQNNFAINFAYEVDSQGCIKSITTDGGQVFYIWYVDEAESADEKPAEPTPPTPVDFRPIRTVRLDESSGPSFCWFEYDSQNRPTKATCQEDGSSGPWVFNYSYPTANSTVITFQGESFTFLKQDGKLTSMTWSSGGSSAFQYDSYGRLASMSDEGTCKWEGNDLKSISGDKNTITFNYSSYQDKNGMSFILEYSQGDIDEVDKYFMLPVFATATGLNSEHLPLSYTYVNNSYSYSYTSDPVSYTFDPRGYIKKLYLGDESLTLWYTDEAESSDEKPSDNPPVQDDDVWYITGSIMNLDWYQYITMTNSGSGVWTANITYNLEESFWFLKNKQWEGAFGYAGSWNQSGDTYWAYLSEDYSADITLPKAGEWSVTLDIPNYKVTCKYLGGGGQGTNEIKTVTGAQFIAASPSQTQLYRLTGAIDEIYKAEFGDFYMKTADGERINIYGANSSPIGYYGSNDKTFAARKLRKGDEITMVGYKSVYNDESEMVFGYVEDSYRLQVSDFVGIYNVVCDMYEFENKLVGWSGTELYYDGEFILFMGMSYYVSEDSSQNWLDNYAAALGYYDDETGTVSLLGSWFNNNFLWYYTDAGENSQRYISIFYPVVFNSTGTDFSWAENVTVGSYSAAGAIVLQPRSELRGSSNFGFERKGSKEESRYVFLDHEYDVEQSQVGNGTYRSAVMQFWYMTRQSTSVSSVRKAGRNGAVRTSAPSPSRAKAKSRKNR